MTTPVLRDDSDGGAVWLDVVAAVDFLSDLNRPGFTVWDALDEAVCRWTVALLEPSDGFAEPALPDLPWDDPDPLRSTLERLTATVAPFGTADGHTLSEVFTSALSAWVERMTDEFNDGCAFAHPSPRRDSLM